MRQQRMVRLFLGRLDTLISISHAQRLTGVPRRGFLRHHPRQTLFPGMGIYGLTCSWKRATSGSVRIRSTQEVADVIGIHKVTLKRWLISGRVAEPKRQSIGGQVVRVWTAQDIQRVREFKDANYRKKPRRKKAGRTKAKRRSKP
jgi:hypothetical protein